MKTEINRIFMLIIAITMAIALYAHTEYNTIYNNFSTLSIPTCAKIERNYIHAENNAHTIFIIDTTSINIPNYKFSARFSCEDRHECGIVFQYENSNNYYAITTLSNKNKYLDEIRDCNSITITLYQIVNGKRNLLNKTDVTENVNFNNGLNTLSIHVNHNTVEVSIGNKKLNRLFKKSITPASQKNHVGFIALPKSNFKLERTVLSYDDCEYTNVNTQWTKEMLDNHFANSKNPYEGYWTYLDRDVNDDILRIGGRYTIALIETKDGYDIIYIDGAQVKKSRWKTGMLKGHLNNTIFTDNYNATWVDATFRSFSEDVYATFESGVILTLKFPIYSSQIRFSKKL